MTDKLRVVTVSSCSEPFGDCGEQTFDFLIGQAADLLTLGFTRAAGCLARQAIERTLLDLNEAKESVGEKCSSLKIGPELAALKAANVLTDENKGRLDLSVDAGNRACHGKPVSASEVFFAIEMARHLRRRVESRICKVKQLAKNSGLADAVPFGVAIPLAVQANYLEPFSIFC